MDAHIKSTRNLNGRPIAYHFDWPFRCLVKMICWHTFYLQTFAITKLQSRFDEQKTKSYYNLWYKNKKHCQIIQREVLRFSNEQWEPTKFPLILIFCFRWIRFSGDARVSTCFFFGNSILFKLNNLKTWVKWDFKVIQSKHLESNLNCR